MNDDPELLRRGKIVYADNCAQCHSSKRPPPTIIDPARRREVLRALVLRDDFLDNNFLSDDRRYPVTELHTNAARALASNTTRGHIWEQFSSETYKLLPFPGPLTGLHNPLDPSRPLEFQPAADDPVVGDGRGYYRTPSLVSMWATAPYFHNNSLGKFTADPTVKGRMDAFHDAVQKLLWPEKRLGPLSVKKTGEPSVLKLKVGAAEYDVHVPRNTPINLLTNIHLKDLPAIHQAVINARGQLTPAVAQLLLEYNQCPDFIEDRGHDYGAELADREKAALIEFLKRL